MRLVKIKVKAKAKQNSIEDHGKDSFIISVKEPAENNRANKAACAILAAHLGVEEKKVVLVKGHTTPSKIAMIYK